MSSGKVIEFPGMSDRLWRDCERFLVAEVLPVWGVSAEEQRDILARLKSHWTWVHHQPAPFRMALPVPEGVAQAHVDAMVQAVDEHVGRVLAVWGGSMLNSIVQLAKVELALARSRSGECSPFDVEWAPKR